MSCSFKFECHLDPGPEQGTADGPNPAPCLLICVILPPPPPDSTLEARDRRGRRGHERNEDQTERVTYTEADAQRHGEEMAGDDDDHDDDDDDEDCRDRQRLP